MKGLATKTYDLSLIPAADLQLVLACYSMSVSTHTYKHTHACSDACTHAHTNKYIFLFLRLEN